MAQEVVRRWRQGLLHLLFRKAHEHLLPGQRAGLVGTNSVSQNRARSASLDYIVANGGTITDAVSSQKWPGEAKVHVSLVNWVNDVGVGPFILDGVVVSGIDSSLHVNAPDAWTPAILLANKGRAFYGPVPIGKGFALTGVEAGELTTEDHRNVEVVRPYLTGSDIISRARTSLTTPTRLPDDGRSTSRRCPWRRRVITPVHCESCVSG